MTKHGERRAKTEELKEHIDNTRENIENAKATISQTDDEELRKELKEKNEHREEAIESFQYELEDEIGFKRLSR